MSSSAPRSPWSPPSLAELQALLPAYHFLALLGRGGMGAVFKATQLSLNRPVAVKVLPASLMEDADANFAARFRQESLTMAKLTHPGIVSVFESGEAGGLLYIVMEFVDGTDVARMIAGEGKVAPELATKLLTQVCEALHYAHERGVVHRDIKPANLLLTRDGTVKIADFGLAKHHDDALLGLTKTNVAIGTPDFLAPEAWTPNTTLDSRADVYALGVTLYQMLTGEVPRGLWKMPSVKAGVDARFDAIIDRAMQPDRAARYQSSAELRRDLERIQAGPGDAHRSASPRRRRMIAALVAIPVVLAGVFALLAWVRPAKQNTIALSGPLKQIVARAADGGPGSLRQAILDSTNGVTITFAPKLSGQTILLTNGELLLNKSVTIDASSLPGGLVINANSNSRVFEIVRGTTNVLTALTIKNGLAAPWQSGGGILNHGHLTVNQSALVGNHAYAGGGIYNTSNGIVTVNQSTLSGNSAKSAGGILNSEGGSVTLNQSTVSGTTAGGGIANDRGGSLTLFNSIVAGNCCPQNGERGSDLFNAGSLNRQGNNIIQDYDDEGGKGIATGPAAITNAPQLAPLGNYGGPRMTMPPLPGSPAIDTGGATPFTTDQRGFPVLAGAAPDIGAVELDTRRVIVTTAADSGPGSLRQAVLDSDTNDTHTIAFAPALAGQVITLTRGEIVLRKSLVITAADLPEGIVIDGNGESRIFRLQDGANVVLSSLTITNGHGNEQAGGILVEPQGTLTLNDCTVVNNTVTGPASFETHGGGIMLDTASFTANRSTLAGNRATLGAGMAGGYSRMILNQCTVAGNVGAKGGGIRVYRGRLELNHCTITGNSCDKEEAGGVQLHESKLTMFNSMVAGNRDADEVTRPDHYRGANLTSGDLHLAPLGRYGGPTATMPPLPGSPAIDTAIGSVFTTDQRGFPRPVGAAPDIGAVEGAVTPGVGPAAVFSPAVPPPANVPSVLAAAQWMAKYQLKFTIATAGRQIEVKRQQDIPAEGFQITGLEFDRWASSLPQPPAGEFQVLGSITTLRSVFMQTIHGPVDEDFAFLARNPQLDRLSIDGSERLSDGMLKYIAGLARLENLKLAHAPRLTGRGFTNAAWLPALKTAEFYFTALDDVALEALAGCPKLDRLVVSDTRITDAGLRALARARALRVLSVEHATRLTARGMAEALPRLGTLQELNANDTPFGDAAAAAISTTLTNLAKLDLRGCPLSDVGLAKLATIPSLRTLNIASTRVTAAGRDAFAAQCPQCVLER